MVCAPARSVRDIARRGVPPIAPAIANGIFRATGKRLRDLPIGPTI